MKRVRLQRTRRSHSRPGLTPPKPNPTIERVRRFHARQNDICDELETMSDALPDFDPVRQLTFFRNLTPELRVHHSLEESWLFPLLADRLSERNANIVNLARLKQEHMEDWDAAVDLGDHVHRFLHDSHADVERFAYQTRALFRSLRRHVAFEVEVVFPIAEDFLTSEDLVCLSHAYKASNLAEVASVLKH